MRTVVAAGPARRVRLIRAGAVLGVMLAAAGVFVVTALGTAPDTAADQARPDVLAAADAGDETTLGALEDTTTASPAPVAPIRMVLERDPFEPVVEEPATGGGPGDGDTGDGTVPNGPDPADPGTGEPGAGDPGGDGTTPPAPATCTGEVEMVCDGQVLRLIDIDRGGETVTADVRVDTADYTVALGEVFAERFAFTGVEGDCISVLFAGETYPLCMTGPTLK